MTEPNTLIIDQGERKYYFQVPNLIDDLHLSQGAYRLYGRMKRVAGDYGKCYQNTQTLAEACDMSTGAVSNAKKELVRHGLIIITKQKRPQGGRDLDVIYIVDIWQRNLDYYTKGDNSLKNHNAPCEEKSDGASSSGELAPSLNGLTTSPDELVNSSHELATSPGEIKNTPLNNTPLKKDSGVSSETPARAVVGNPFGEGSPFGNDPQLQGPQPEGKGEAPASERAAARPTRRGDDLGAVMLDLLTAWRELFPDKPQPKPTNKANQKVLSVRWKNPEFREAWRAAMERAARSPSLHTDTWFDFNWFLNHKATKGENWERLLAGEFDWKDRQRQKEAELGARQAEQKRKEENASASRGSQRIILGVETP